MNDRIKKLAEQAGINLPDDSVYNGHIYKNAVERFAGLIVVECISIVDDAERGGSNEIWDNAVKFIKRDLQEHFGVE